MPSFCYYLRLNDPAQSFSQSSSDLRFSLQNPYDALMYTNGTLFCMELKSFDGCLTFWKEEFEDKEKKQSFNIKKNQIHGLEKASKTKGVIAGFVLNFRKNNHTYFLGIDKFNEMISKIEKKSINEQNIIDAGGYLIEQTLKKVKYNYNVEKFISDMIKI